MFKPFYRLWREGYDQLKNNRTYCFIRKKLMALMLIFLVAFNLALFSTPVNAFEDDSRNTDNFVIDNFSDYKDIDGGDYSLKGNGEITDPSSNLRYNCLVLDPSSVGTNYVYKQSNYTAYKTNFYKWISSEPKYTNRFYNLASVLNGSQYLVNDTANSDNYSSSIVDDGNFLIDSNDSFSFYKIFEFVPKWNLSGKKLFSTNPSTYYSNGSNELNAYYKYVRADNEQYGNFQKIDDISIEYFYSPSDADISYDSKKSDTYTEQYETIENVGYVSYKLQEMTNTRYFNDINNITYGSENFSSQSYAKNNFIYLWNEEEKCFNPFSIYDKNVIEEIEVSSADKKVLTKINENYYGSISISDQNKLITELHNYYKRQEQLYKTVQTENVTSGTTTDKTVFANFFKDKTYTYYDLSNDPVSYDAKYTYEWNYITNNNYRHKAVYDRMNYVYNKTTVNEVTTNKTTTTYSLVKKLDKVLEPNGNNLDDIKTLVGENKLYVKNKLSNFIWKIYIENSNNFYNKTNSKICEKVDVMTEVENTSYNNETVYSKNGNYYTKLYDGTYKMLGTEKIKYKITSEDSSKTTTPFPSTTIASLNNGTVLDYNGKSLVKNGFPFTPTDIAENESIEYYQLGQNTGKYEQKDVTKYNNYYRTTASADTYSGYKSSEPTNSITKLKAISQNISASEVANIVYYQKNENEYYSKYKYYTSPHMFFVKVQPTNRDDKVLYWATPIACINKYSLSDTEYKNSLSKGNHYITKIDAFTDRSEIWYSLTEDEYSSGKFDFRYKTQEEITLKNKVGIVSKDYYILEHKVGYYSYNNIEYSARTVNSQKGSIVLRYGYEIATHYSDGTGGYNYDRYSTQTFKGDSLATTFSLDSTSTYRNFASQLSMYYYYDAYRIVFNADYSQLSKESIGLSGDKYYYKNEEITVQEDNTDRPIYEIILKKVTKTQDALTQTQNTSNPVGVFYNSSSARVGAVNSDGTLSSSVPSMTCEIDTSFDNNNCFYVTYFNKEYNSMNYSLFLKIIKVNVLSEYTFGEEKNGISFSNISNLIQSNNELMTAINNVSLSNNGKTLTITWEDDSAISSPWITTTLEKSTVFLDEAMSATGNYQSSDGRIKLTPTYDYTIYSVNSNSSSTTTVNDDDKKTVVVFNKTPLSNPAPYNYPSSAPVTDSTTSSNKNSVNWIDTVVQTTTKTVQYVYYSFKSFTKSSETVTLYVNNTSLEFTPNYTGNEMIDGVLSSTTTTLVKASTNPLSTGLCYELASKSTEKISSNTITLYKTKEIKDASHKTTSDDFSNDSNSEAYYGNNYPDETGYNKRIASSETDTNCFLIPTVKIEYTPRYSYVKHDLTLSTQNYNGSIVDINSSSANSEKNSIYDENIIVNGSYDIKGYISGGTNQLVKSSSLTSKNIFNQNNWFVNNLGNVLRYLDNDCFVFVGKGEATISSLGLSGQYYFSFDTTSFNNVILKANGETVALTTDGTRKYCLVDFNSQTTIKFVYNNTFNVKNISIKKDEYTYSEYATYSKIDESIKSYYVRRQFKPEINWEYVLNNDKTDYLLETKAYINGFYDKTNKIVVSIKSPKDFVSLYIENNNLTNNNYYTLYYAGDFNNNKKIDENEKNHLVNDYYINIYEGTTKTEEYRYVKIGDNLKLNYKTKRKTSYKTYGGEYISKNDLKTLDNSIEIAPSTISDSSDQTQYVLYNGDKYDINSKKGMLLALRELDINISNNIYYNETDLSFNINIEPNINYYCFNQQYDLNKEIASNGNVSLLDSGYTKEKEFLTKNELCLYLDALNSQNTEAHKFVKTTNIAPYYYSANSNPYLLSEKYITSKYFPEYLRQKLLTNIILDEDDEIASCDLKTQSTKNLLNIADASEKTQNGITYSIKDGVISLNGTTNADYVQLSIPVSCKLNGTYSINLFNNLTIPNSSFYLNHDSYSTTFEKINNSRVLTIDSDFEVTYLRIYIHNKNTNVKNVVLKPMLIEGNIIPSYFKSYIESFEKEYETINLLNIEDVSEKIQNGITYSIKDGIISLNGTTSVNYLSIIIPVSLQLNGSYIFSGFNNEIIDNSAIYFNSDKYGLTLTSLDATKTFETSESLTVTNLKLYIHNEGTKVNNVIIKPMLVNDGKKPIEFVQYDENLLSKSESIIGNNLTNLLNISDLNETTNYGMTYNFKNGIITVSGTSSVDNYVVQKIATLRLDPTKKYTFKTFVDNESVQDVRLVLKRSSTWNNNYCVYKNATGSVQNSVTFTPLEEEYNLYLMTTKTNGVSSIILKPMLIEGDNVPIAFKKYSNSTERYYRSIITFDALVNDYVKLKSFCKKNLYNILIDDSLFDDSLTHFTYNDKKYKLSVNNDENPIIINTYKEYEPFGYWLNYDIDEEINFYETTVATDDNDLVNSIWSNGSLSFYTFGAEAIKNSTATANDLYSIEGYLNIYKNDLATSKTSYEENNSPYSNNLNEHYYYKYSLNQYEENVVVSIPLNQLYSKINIEQENNKNSIYFYDNNVKHRIVLKELFITEGSAISIYKLQSVTKDLSVSNIIDFDDLQLLDFNNNSMSEITQKLSNKESLSYRIQFSGMQNFWNNTINNCDIFTLDKAWDCEVTDLNIVNKKSTINYKGDEVSEFILNKVDNGYELYALSQIYDDGIYYHIDEVINDLIVVLNILAKNEYTGYFYSNSVSGYSPKAKEEIKDAINSGIIKNKSFAGKSWEYFASTTFTSELLLRDVFSDSSYANIINIDQKLASILNIKNSTSDYQPIVDLYNTNSDFCSGGLYANYYKGILEVLYNYLLLGYHYFDKSLDIQPYNSSDLASDTFSLIVEKINCNLANSSFFDWLPWYSEGTFDDEMLEIFTTFSNVICSYYSLTDDERIKTVSLKRNVMYNDLLDMYMSTDYIHVNRQIVNGVDEKIEFDGLKMFDFVFQNLLTFAKEHGSGEYMFVRSNKNENVYYIYEKLTSSSSDGKTVTNPLTIIRQNRTTDYGEVLTKNENKGQPEYFSIKNILLKKVLPETSIYEIHTNEHYKAFYTSDSTVINNLSLYIPFSEIEKTSEIINFYENIALNGELKEFTLEIGPDDIRAEELLAFDLSKYSYEDPFAYKWYGQTYQEINNMINELRNDGKTDLQIKESIYQYCEDYETEDALSKRIEYLKYLNEKINNKNNNLNLDIVSVGETEQVLYYKENVKQTNKIHTDFEFRNPFLAPFPNYFQYGGCASLFAKKCFGRFSNTDEAYEGYEYFQMDSSLYSSEFDADNNILKLKIKISNTNIDKLVINPSFQFIDDEELFSTTTVDKLESITNGTYCHDEFKYNNWEKLIKEYFSTEINSLSTNKTANYYIMQNKDGTLTLHHGEYGISDVSRIEEIGSEFSSRPVICNSNSDVKISVRAIINDGSKSIATLSTNGVSYNKELSDAKTSVDIVTNTSTDTNYEIGNTSFNVTINNVSTILKYLGQYNSENFEYSLSYDAYDEKNQANYTKNNDRFYYNGNGDGLFIKDKYDSSCWNTATLSNGKYVITNLLPNKEYTLMTRQRLFGGYTTRPFTTTFVTDDDMVYNPYGTSLKNVDMSKTNDDELLKNEIITYQLQQCVYSYDKNPSNVGESKFTLDGKSYTISNKYRLQMKTPIILKIAFKLYDVETNQEINFKNYTPDIKLIPNNSALPDLEIKRVNNIFYLLISDDEIKKLLNETYNRNSEKLIEEFVMINYTIRFSTWYSTNTEYSLKCSNYYDDMYTYLDFNQNSMFDDDYLEGNYYDIHGQKVVKESQAKFLYCKEFLDDINWVEIETTRTNQNGILISYNTFMFMKFGSGKYDLLVHKKNNKPYIVR